MWWLNWAQSLKMIQARASGPNWPYNNPPAPFSTRHYRSRNPTPYSLHANWPKASVVFLSVFSGVEVLAFIFAAIAILRVVQLEKRIRALERGGDKG